MVSRLRRDTWGQLQCQYVNSGCPYVGDVEESDTVIVRMLQGHLGGPKGRNKSFQSNRLFSKPKLERTSEGRRTRASDSFRA